MPHSKIRKIVTKKISDGKKFVKSSKMTVDNKNYVEMFFHTEEKTLDSNSLIKECQKRVSDFIIEGIEYSPITDNSEKFLREHVNSRVNIFVMYVDLVNSTNITLTLPAEKVVKLITSFAQEMVHIVTQFDGYSLKFVGDAVLA